MRTDCVSGLLETAMENIKAMVEVNTVVGDAVETPSGTVIIPVSRMCCGFASGGTHVAQRQSGERRADAQQEPDTQPPFGGGAGAGVSVQPVGFLLVNDKDIRFQVVDHSAILDRLLDEVPQMVEKVKSSCNKSCRRKAQSGEFTRQLEQVLQNSWPQNGESGAAEPSSQQSQQSSQRQ